jgi:hypothetical protein
MACAPRVVPFLRPYRTGADIAAWFNDPEIYATIEAELRRDPGHRGIGEFHVCGADAGGIGLKRMVALAVERNLWLHAHRDDAALEILFRHDPGVKNADRARRFAEGASHSSRPSSLAQPSRRPRSPCSPIRIGGAFSIAVFAAPEPRTR